MACVGGPGVSLTHIQLHGHTSSFCIGRHPLTKEHNINLECKINTVLKAFPMSHGSANSQHTICKHIQHKIVTMVQTSYEQENKVCHQVRESFTY